MRMDVAAVAADNDDEARYIYWTDNDTESMQCASCH